MTRSRLLIAATLVVVAVVVGGYIAYDQVLRGDSVAALALPSASTAASSSTAATASSGSSAAPAASTTDVAGTWNIASGSQAGYRVREQLANLPAESDAPTSYSWLRETRPFSISEALAVVPPMSNVITFW